MSTRTYIMVDDDFQKQVLKELSELRSLLQTNITTKTAVSDDELMDGVDVERYLRCSRRTVYVMRKNGLPSIRKENGRLYYWKSQIDKYLGKPQPEINEVLKL